VLSGFLLVFIPLYPKIPLAELIPGYIVRMRLEDIFVLFTAIVWFIQLLRKKVKIKSITIYLIALYLIIATLSLISAIVITHNIPWQPIHLGKSFLHLVRYLEYFFLFIITFSSIKSMKDVKLLLKLMLIAFLAIIIYGYGQKYNYWPVFSTMNREFSKGIRLYLTEHARVQSTFGGHYDLAAYLVMLLNLILAFALSTHHKIRQIGFHLLHLLGLWLLLVTASRVSFGAYYVGVVVTIVVLATAQSSIYQQIKWGLTRTTIITSLILVMMLVFGADMRDRLFQVVKQYPQIEQSYTQIEDFADKTSKNVMVFIGLKKRSVPTNDDWVAVNLSDQMIDSVLDKTDQRPVSQSRPDDVYVDVPDKVKVATQSASGKTEYIFVEKERTWSDNALKYGLSTAIRLDTLWPNAIKGFKHNPLLGAGFATLNKESLFHFTEAESTDNNFLRTLGETGLLGFFSFYFILLMNIYLAWSLLQISLHHQKLRSTLITALTAGYIGASIGLLVNATYIDVYASSKVAFIYWALSGILVAICYQSPYQKIIKIAPHILDRYSAKNRFTEKVKRNKLR
jgi:hypothetical protein